MKQILNAADLKNIFRGGKLNLSIHRQTVDNLNVFPVPDGDTGTNMSLTMNACVKEMDAASETVEALSVAIAKGALKGARGNSGVILSQIFKGMTAVFAEGEEITVKVFARALVAGAQKAYSAVVNPKEGTILTVIRLIGDYAEKIARRNLSFADFFEKIIQRGNEVLAETPELLPVLKKAGVVDSGGQGLLYIIIGMYNAFVGIEMKEPESDEQETQTATTIADVNDYENITFSYCTEYFIINLKKQITLADIDKLRDKLVEIGDCVLVVGELDVVKVHVHTNNPNKALEYALTLGELDRVKIENMLEQYRKIHGEEKTRQHKERALLTVCAGKGFADVFSQCGADIIEGGQTMNPSVDDIVKAVKKMNADTVFVLPNNKNIILACNQAVSMVDCRLTVIPTKNVMEGVAAAMMFEEGNSDELNESSMNQYAKEVTGIEITHAVKDADADDFEVKTGDIIALKDKIIAKGESVSEVAMIALEMSVTEDSCVIDLYYGEGVEKRDAEGLLTVVSERFPDCDVHLIYGGQPHYYYFIGIA